MDAEFARLIKYNKTSVALRLFGGIGFAQLQAFCPLLEIEFPRYFDITPPVRHFVVAHARKIGLSADACPEPTIQGVVPDI